MMTALQKIGYFNNLIGNPKGGCTGLRQQFDMIREEFEELEKALVQYEKLQDCVPDQFTAEMDIWLQEEAASVIEIRDGIADVIVTTGGLAHRMGIDADSDLEEVYRSNMSKFINTNNMLEVQAATLEVAARLGIECSAAETAPGIWAITSERDQTGKDGKLYPKGKLLKPATYREPKFCPF